MRLRAGCGNAKTSGDLGHSRRARTVGILVRTLSITAVNRAGSTGCAVLLALAGCASTPPPAPAPPPPATAPPSNPPDLVAWDEKDSAAIHCLHTEAHVEVPEAWRSAVRRINEAEIVLEPAGEHHGAILVRAADHRLTTGDGLDDMKRLFELAGIAIPKALPQSRADVLNEEILPSIDFIDMNSTPIEFEQEPPDTGTFVIGYHIVVADDATCRLAFVAPKSDPIVSQLTAFLDDVVAHRPFQWGSTSLTHPPKPPKIPPASCKAWPVWMFPVCRPAPPAPKPTR